MTCKYCGCPLEDDSVFCSECGRPVEGAPDDNFANHPVTGGFSFPDGNPGDGYSENYADPGFDDEDEFEDENSGSSKKIVAIILAVVVVLAGLGVGGFFVYRHFWGNETLATGTDADKGDDINVDDIKLAGYSLAKTVDLSVPANWESDFTSQKKATCYNGADVIFEGYVLPGEISSKDDAEDIMDTLTEGKFKFTFKKTVTDVNEEFTGFEFTASTKEENRNVLKQYTVFGANGKAIVLVYFDYKQNGNFALSEKIFSTVKLFGEEKETTTEKPEDDMPEVPLFEGMQSDKVLNSPEYTELFAFVTSEKYDDEIEQGVIISQSIEKGTKVEKGTTDKLVISKGSEPFSLPEYKGKTFNEAKKDLEDLGLKVKIETVPNNGEGEANTVQSTKPVAGKPVQKGDTVTLYILDKETETTTAKPEPEPTTAKPAVAPTTGSYTVAANPSLRLRADHSTGSESIVSIPDGTAVTVSEVYYDANGTEETMYWGKVTYEGNTGWVAMAYLAK